MTQNRNLAECGTSRIFGCRFSLYVMSDRFAEVILGALKETDTSKVWMETDDVSTCIRGRQSHVFDVTKAIFVKAASTGDHVSLNGTFSVGCPGDTAGDVYMSEDDVLMNEDSIRGAGIATACQFALYPMGVGHYMDLIYAGCKPAQEMGVFTGGIHYASRLDGSADEVFAALYQAFDVVQKEASHTLLTFNLSANSPSRSRPREVGAE